MRVHSVCKASILSLALATLTMQGQCPACPIMTQIASDQGMASGATASLMMTANGDSTGSISTGDASTMEDAADLWTGMKGSNGDVSASSYGSPVDIAAMFIVASETNPIFIVERVTNSTAAANCDGGAPSCAFYNQDGSNITIDGIILISDAIFNGTVATDFPLFNPVSLGDAFSHEYGVHELMGWTNSTDTGTAAGNLAGPPYVVRPGECQI